MEIKIIDKIKNLRNCINKSLILKQKVYESKDVGKWHKLWSSMDVLEDSQCAIDIFVQKENIDKLDKYGLLQAIYVQQDAILHLEDSLDLRNGDLFENKDWVEIRFIRIETIGHPTDIRIKKTGKKNDYKNGNISYSSIYTEDTKKILRYIIYSKLGNKVKEIDLEEVISKHSRLILEEIERIISEIDVMEKEHKKKFQNKKLANSICGLNYEFGTLYPFEQERKLSRMSLGVIQDKFSKLKIEYKERYGKNSLSKDSIQNPGLVDLVLKIESMLSRIDELVDLETDTLELDLEIYVDALQIEFANLEEMLEIIDKKFKI